MSVGFIGAGQLAHALVKGFTAAGKLWILAHFILTIRINNIAAIVKITPKVLLRLKYNTKQHVRVMLSIRTYFR